jgi:hypothetical protein
VPENVRREMTFFPVGTVEEVLAQTLPAPVTRPASTSTSGDGAAGRVGSVAAGRAKGPE